MASALRGIDVLAFTGGVGERSPEIREQAASGMRFMGIAISADRNAAAAGDSEVTLEGAIVRTLVIRSREDLEIARQTRSVLD